MSSDQHRLLIRLEANVAQLRMGLRNAERQVQASTAAMQRDVRALDDSFSGIKAGAIGLVSAIGLERVGSQVYEVNKSFQDLRAGLETAMGSADKARVAFEQIKVLARETPYSLQEVTTAFLKLKNLGLDTSAESMTAWGDIAASMPGKGIMDWVEAVADASTGEFERLKEFGIKASSENDKVTITFKGVSTTIKKEAAAIEEYLLRLAQVNFGGAMGKRMEGLGGQVSNLKDDLDALFVTIGEAGAVTAMAGVLRMLAEGVKWASDNFDVLIDVSALVGAVLIGRVTPAVLSSVSAMTQYSRALLTNIATEGRYGAVSITGSRATLARATATLEAAEAERSAAAATVQRLAADKEALQANAQRIAQERALAVKQVELQAGIVAATGRTAGYTKAVEARKASTRALVETEKALRVTTVNLAAAETALGASSEKATQAQVAQAAAVKNTSLAARAAAVAGKGLNAVMAFFGGPIGLAITAAATATYFLATAQDDAAKAADLHRDAIAEFDKIVDLSTGDLKAMTKEIKTLTLARLEEAAAAKEMALASAVRETGNSSTWGLTGQTISYGAEAARAVYEAGTAYKQMVAAGEPDALEKYVAALEEIKALSPDAARAVNDEFSKLSAVQQLGDDLRDIEARMAAIMGTASQEQKERIGLGQPMQRAVPAADVDEKAAKKLKTVIENLELERDQLGRSNREQTYYTALKQAGVEASSAQAVKIREVVDALYDEKEARDELTQFLDKEAEYYDKGKKLKDGLRTASEKYADTIKTISELQEAGAISTETYNRALTEAKRELDSHNKDLQELKDFGEGAFDTIGSSIVQAMEDGKGAFYGLRQAGSAVLSDLASWMLKLAVMNPLKNMIGQQLFGQAAAQAAPTFGSMFAFADGGIMTGSGPVPLRKYAGGGIARSPQLALFGETSVPEAFVPVPSGRIPVELRGAVGGGGGTVVNVIDQRRGDSAPAQVSRSSSGGLEVFEVMIKDTVVRDFNTGGPISRSAGRRFGMSPKGV